MSAADLGIVNREAKNADDLVGRLYNWKFKQALAYLDGQPDEVGELVRVLAATFGSGGWEDGNMGAIVSAAVRRLIGTDTSDEAAVGGDIWRKAFRELAEESREEVGVTAEDPADDVNKVEVFKVELMVVDHDGVGEAEVRSLLENARYPNHCISPNVSGMNSRDVTWSDDHPLNNRRLWLGAFRELFDGGP